MKKAAFVLGFFCFIFSCYGNAQTVSAKTVFVRGEKARILLSLLASGNESIRRSLKDKAARQIKIHDLSILAESTYKFDPDHPFYKLSIFSAKAKIGTAEEAVNLGEASSLYEYFSRMKLEPDVGLEGASLEISAVDCKINITKVVTSDQRYECRIRFPISK